VLLAAPWSGAQAQWSALAAAAPLEEAEAEDLEAREAPRVPQGRRGFKPFGLQPPRQGGGAQGRRGGRRRDPAGDSEQCRRGSTRGGMLQVLQRLTAPALDSRVPGQAEEPSASPSLGGYGTQRGAQSGSPSLLAPAAEPKARGPTPAEPNAGVSSDVDDAAKPMGAPVMRMLDLFTGPTRAGTRGCA